MRTPVITGRTRSIESKFLINLFYQTHRMLVYTHQMLLIIVQNQNK